MPGAVDLHNHILHDIDDGPRSIRESLLLCRAMVEAGYDTVAVTPHTCEGRPAPALIMQRMRELQKEIDREGLALTLLPGSEQHIEPLTLERLERGEIQTLNNTSYLLLELPMLQPLPVYTEQLIVNLVSNGYRPIIPHPERVLVLQNRLDRLKALHEIGALFQVTWGALNGILGRKVEQTARAMVRAGLAHLFASDAHNATSRLLTIEKAAAELVKINGPGSDEEMLVTRPRRVIEGLEIS